MQIIIILLLLALLFGFWPILLIAVGAWILWAVLFALVAIPVGLFLLTRKTRSSRLDGTRPRKGGWWQRTFGN